MLYGLLFFILMLTMISIVLHATAPCWGPPLVAAIIRRAQRDTSQFHISGYMNRWWLLKYPDVPKDKRRWWHIGIRVHQILRGDSDRHLHDHPWWNISIILKGRYMEMLPLVGQRFIVGQRPRTGWDKSSEPVFQLERGPGDIILRGKTFRHKLLIEHGEPVWSLFICGPWRQDWGFYVPNLGKIYWREYLCDWGEE